MSTASGRSIVGSFRVSNVGFVQRRVESWIESNELELKLEWSNYDGLRFAVLIASGPESERVRCEGYCDALSDCDGIVADWFEMKKAAAERE